MTAFEVFGIFICNNQSDIMYYTHTEVWLQNLIMHLVFSTIINLCYRNWGADCFEAHSSTWLYRDYTGEHKQREVFLIFQLVYIHVFDMVK